MLFNLRPVAATLIVATGMYVSSAHAAAIVSGFDANTLAAGDDNFSAFVSLPFSLNFYGTNYSGLYVNNNGNVTFNQPQSTFTPYGLGAGYTGQPIIAPFFADIDTRGSGTVTYGDGSYNGHAAFGVTYSNVGYYSGGTDKTNTFQLILTDRSDTGNGNFDIYFNYSQIQFETGNASGGTDGLGGTSASVGFSAGTGADGTYYQAPGSLVNGALLDGGPNSLAASNNGLALFAVRSGDVIVSPVPLPASAPMFGAALLGLAGLGYAAKRKKAASAA